MPVNIAGVSMITVEPRTPCHTATTARSAPWLSGTAMVSVVGTRPLLAGAASLEVKAATGLATVPLTCNAK